VAIRKYPSRTEPFVSQKSPHGRRGPGFGIGAVVFVLLLLGLSLLLVYVIPPLMDEMVFPDIGIPYSTLFFIILGFTVLVTIALMVRIGMYTDNRIMYRDRDPSICKRLIKDGPDGIEVIVSGGKRDTFAQACRDDWQFNSVSQKSKWFIKDEKGNDVSDRSLESSDGVFILIPEYGSEPSKAEPDESERYSSLHDSVEYYD